MIAEGGGKGRLAETNWRLQHDEFLPGGQCLLDLFKDLLLEPAHGSVRKGICESGLLLLRAPVAAFRAGRRPLLGDLEATTTFGAEHHLGFTVTVFCGLKLLIPVSGR